MGRVCRVCRVCALAVAVALVLAVSSLAQAQGSPPAGAADLDAARALADNAMDLYEAGKYQEAIQRFKDAEAVYHAPPHMLFLGRAHAKLGKQAAACTYYRRLAGEQLPPNAPEPFRQAQREAKAELEALEARMPKVRIELVGASADEAVVIVDGETLGAEAIGAPLPLDPGDHVASVSVAGGPEVVERFALAEGEPVQTIELVVGSVEGGEGTGGSPDEPASGDDGGPSFAGPLAVLGIGVAGLGVGVITGILTLNDASELKDKCPTNPCLEEHESLADSVHSLGTTSTVAFIVGGAAVGAGLIWLLAQPSAEASEEETAVSVEPLIGPLGAGVRGRF